MLTIYRRAGESVYIGDDKIEVIDIQYRAINIEVNNEPILLKHGQHISIGKTYIFLLSMLHKKVEMGFEGPKDVTILRGELYENPNFKKKKVSKKRIVSNATKQFPSGDY